MSTGQPLPEPTRIQSKDTAIPVEVVILTSDHEILGIVHVSRDAKEDRRISDLLNNPDRRFLAVTDARLINRKCKYVCSNPQCNFFMICSEFDL